MQKLKEEKAGTEPTSIRVIELLVLKEGITTHELNLLPPPPSYPFCSEEISCTQIYENVKKCRFLDQRSQFPASLL